MIATAAPCESSHFQAEAAGIVRTFAAVHGMKRGLYLAAEAAGVKPSRAREILYARARRIEAHELLRLRAAALELDMQRLKKLEAETAALRARLGLEGP